MAWGTAAGTTPQSDLTIMEQLGVGVVTFQDAEEEKVLPALPNFDYTYRTNTRVVTTVALHNELPVNLTPVDGVTVTFDILGNTYRVPFVCPSGSTQMVWVDWETPDTPQLVEIGIASDPALSPAARRFLEFARPYFKELMEEPYPV